MSNNHTGNTQPAIDQEEHAHIGGAAGKKVFVMDDAGNVITSFGSATVSILSLPSIDGQVSFKSLSFYEQASLASGYVFYGQTEPGSNPTTASFKILRETLNSGEVLFASGTPAFTHVWSSASLASIAYS